MILQWFICINFILWASIVLFNPPYSSICGAVIDAILILHMKELRSRKGKIFTQAHIAREWQESELELKSLTL